MNLKRRLTAGLLALALVCTLSPAAFADPATYAACDLLANVTTGETYYAKNIDVARDPASITKLMTVYMVYEAMARGELTKGSKVSISAHTNSIASDATASNVPLSTGQTYTVDELLGATLIASACGAACALGEKLGGTESKFAALMTNRAKQLGWAMSFSDASGLDGKNRMTARAIMALSTELLTKYPDVLNYTARSSVYFRGKSYRASNYLLPGGGFAYDGADGLKTGTTSAAGRCLVATAARGGNRLVAVVLGAGNDDTRFGDAIRMLDSGFDRAITLYRSSQRFSVNGNAVSLGAYGYGGTNYVSPRDLSAALSGTANAFSVGWNGATKTVSLTTDGSAAAASVLRDGVGARRTDVYLRINGEEASAAGFVAGGTNYFSLRDLAPALGLSIGYDSASDTVLITTEPPVTAAVQNIMLDGKPAALEVCYIGDTGYYKLRDVAMLLNGTAKRFEIVWDAAAKSVNLISNAAYTPAGGEMGTADAGKLRFAKPGSSNVMLDGAPLGAFAYCIGENNYFKLRDLAAALGFGVEWDQASRTVVLTTADSSTAPPSTSSSAVQSASEEETALPEVSVAA